LIQIEKGDCVSNLFLVLIIAFLILVLAIAILAIGWLIKGKTKIEKTCVANQRVKSEEHDLNRDPKDLEEQQIPPSSHS
jgi:hypothetical protein